MVQASDWCARSVAGKRRDSNPQPGETSENERERRERRERRQRPAPIVLVLVGVLDIRAVMSLASDCSAVSTGPPVE
jgi:hypothetical protein